MVEISKPQIDADAIVPARLADDIQAALVQHMKTVEAPWTSEKVVDVDLESGWRQLVFQITLDAPLEERRRLWDQLSGLVEKRIDSWRSKDKTYGASIGVWVRPAWAMHAVS